MGISKETIMNIIETKYKYLVKKYSEINILGIFTVGVANYGFAENEYDIETVAIYIPTFDDLCITPAEVWMDEGIRIVDVRRLYNSLDTCKWGALELLYSDYYIVSPKYQMLYNNFLMQRDIIADCDKYNRIGICYDRAKEAYKNKDYFELARLEIAVDIYLNGGDAYSAFHPSKNYIVNYLWDIKTNKIELEAEPVLDSLEQTLEKARDLEPNRHIANSIIKKGIVDIISTALEENVSVDTFMTSLTKNEQTALAAILNKLDNGGNGNISITKLVEETNISRPVFKNLLTKIEKNNIATINNQGVKGTYITLKTSLS